MCKDTGLAFEAAGNLINPTSSLATYCGDDIKERAQKVTALVLTHGWCQIHLMSNAQLQLSFKLRAGQLTAQLVPSEEVQTEFPQVLEEIRNSIKEILAQEKILEPA